MNKFREYMERKGRKFKAYFEIRDIISEAGEDILSISKAHQINSWIGEGILEWTDTVMSEDFERDVEEMDTKIPDAIEEIYNGKFKNSNEKYSTDEIVQIIYDKFIEIDSFKTYKLYNQYYEEEFGNKIDLRETIKSKLSRMEREGNMKEFKEKMGYWEKKFKAYDEIYNMIEDVANKTEVIANDNGLSSFMAKSLNGLLDHICTEEREADADYLIDDLFDQIKATYKDKIGENKGIYSNDEIFEIMYNELKFMDDMEAMRLYGEHSRDIYGDRGYDGLEKFIKDITEEGFFDNL